MNYLDRSLGSLASGDWRYLHHYYGPNLQRLREVKAAVDPANVFVRPQGIPPAGMQPPQQQCTCKLKTARNRMRAQ